MTAHTFPMPIPAARDARQEIAPAAAVEAPVEYIDLDFLDGNK